MLVYAIYVFFYERGGIYLFSITKYKNLHIKQIMQKTG